MKRVLFAIIPTLVILVISGAVLEAWLRWRYESIEQITGAAEWRTADFAGITYLWDRYHPTLGWTNLPGYRSDPSIPFTVTINSQGLRSTRDFAPRPDTGIHRIALFGDSLVFGEEVDDGHTIADHMQNLRPDTEVLNYGVHGYGLGQSILRLEIEGGELAPDRYIVAVLFPEDLVRAGASHFVHAKPVFQLVDGEVEIGNIPVPEASRLPWFMRTSFASAWVLGRRGAWHRHDAASDADVVELGRALVLRAAAICEERGLPLTVVVLLAPAGLQQYLAEPAWRQTIDDARDRFLALPVDALDLVPVQKGAYLEHGNALVAPLAHWSSQGNRIWAEQILRHLENQSAGEYSR